MTFDLKITNAHAYSILAYAFVASYGQVYYSEPEVCTSLSSSSMMCLLFC